LKSIYFYLPEYPNSPTGGLKYHNIVFEYFKQKCQNVYLAGTGKFSEYSSKNKFFKILFGLYCSVKIPKNSVIFLSNAAFLHFALPLFLNRIYKNHYYFMIVHHLSVNETDDFLRRNVEKFFVKNANKIIAISETTKKDLYANEFTTENDIPIIPPGLDNIKYDFTDKRSLDGKFRLLAVSTIEERKGLIYCIQALKELENSSIELDIIGEISEDNLYYQMLQKKIRDLGLERKIFFRGRVSKAELENYFRNAEAFIFPTLWEGYGMVIAEAMAYALPVIASGIPASKELIIDGTDGLLFEPGNIKDLVSKINFLTKDRTKYKKISVNAYLKSKTFPTWEQTSEKLFDIYKSIE